MMHHAKECALFEVRAQMQKQNNILACAKDAPASSAPAEVETVCSSEVVSCLVWLISRRVNGQK
jgi:hypothetical protein